MMRKLGEFLFLLPIMIVYYIVEVRGWGRTDQLEEWR